MTNKKPSSRARSRKKKPLPESVRLKNNKRERHHRKPVSAGGKNDIRNVSKVRHVYHVAYHRLFGAGNPDVVVDVLNATWTDPDVYIIAIKRTDYTKNKELIDSIKL